MTVGSRIRGSSPPYVVIAGRITIAGQIKRARNIRLWCSGSRARTQPLLSLVSRFRLKDPLVHGCELPRSSLIFRWTIPRQLLIPYLCLGVGIVSYAMQLLMWNLG